ncbi:MAG TPA: hypothetical protein VER37_10905, partial [Thermomicrobiales bacterium]|nr:hypothetical protein [Thermomicrobiales bacterium]
MTDRALNDRLRQKSRRSGLAVGLSMILTIALFLGAAAMIYALLMPLLQDVIPITAPRSAPAAVAPGPISRSVDQQPQSAQITTEDSPAPAQPADEVLQAPEPTPTPEPEPTPTEAPFEPTHQVNALQSVNLRNGPNGQIIQAIPIAAPLRYLN